MLQWGHSLLLHFSALAGRKTWHIWDRWKHSFCHHPFLTWTHPQTTAYHTPSLDCHWHTPFALFLKFRYRSIQRLTCKFPLTESLGYCCFMQTSALAFKVCNCFSLFVTIDHKFPVQREVSPQMCRRFSLFKFLSTLVHISRTGALSQYFWITYFLVFIFDFYRWISAINLLIRQLQRTWAKLFLRCTSNALEGMAGAGPCTFSRLLPGCCTSSLRWLALESWFLSCPATGCPLAISYPLVKRKTGTVVNY